MLYDEAIGTAKDNLLSPIHNWYKYTAGFSFKLVKELIKDDKLHKFDSIFDPFAGCGTTLVEAQKNQIHAVGNESQDLMFGIIKAKLNWKLQEKVIIEHIKKLDEYIKTEKGNNFKKHPLIDSLYTSDNISDLYKIRDYVTREVDNEDIALFLNLGLSQTLHKCSKHPISAPYITRNKVLKGGESAWTIFKSTSIRMLNDLKELKDFDKTSTIYMHDSRLENKNIDDNSCNICITSPPYLNNLDYGEISKVQTHFFEITTDWADITNKVRKNLVTASTTQYKEQTFIEDEWKKSEFYEANKVLADKLIIDVCKIKEERKKRSGSKSYDIMTLLYFQDMYKVLKETYRVLNNNSKKAYIVVGDSAPYGIHMPTTDILSEIALTVGFNNFEKHKIRERGTKWKSLTHRHSLCLDENILILK